MSKREFFNPLKFYRENKHKFNEDNNVEPDKEKVGEVIINWEKWLHESTILKGEYRSGRNHFCKKGNYGRMTDNYKYLTQCFDVTDAVIVK